MASNLFYQHLKFISLLATLFIISAPTSKAFDLDFLKESLGQIIQRPSVKFPVSFEAVLSNNDPGLNITEVVYFD